MPAAPDPASLRRDYTRAGLSEGDLAVTWHEQFAGWFADAVAAGLNEPNAVVLATASADAVPSARTVLLKQVDEHGLVVFTNSGSRKARELAENPRGSLVVPWLDLERQVVVCGGVQRVTPEMTADYFGSRPRGSQLGAWVSRQSEVIASREVLEQRQAELEQRFAGGQVPVPPFWGGWRLVPQTVEFWQGRPGRLHDRLRFRRSAAAAEPGAASWVVERLSP